MKGDFTRATFRKEKHYRKVNMQQGRVQTDADWNEQNEIQFHYETTYLKDMVGKNGTLADNGGGFNLSGNYSFEWSKIGAPTDAGVDIDTIAGLKRFLVNNFGLLWITDSTNFARIGADKLSISGTNHSAVIEKTGSKATFAVDGQSKYEFRVINGNVVYSRGFLIGPGNYYVDGILCENDHTIDSTRQQYLVDKLIQPSKYLAYLDVWEHHISYLDDSHIREQALGDVDTATRSKITWQVKLVDIGSQNVSNPCALWESVLADMKSTTGMMQARVKPSPESTDRCSLYETAGYTRLENQLYRIEVHNAGNLAEATFKWSRDNGTVVSKVTEFKSAENTLVIQRRGKDSLLDFQKDGWVEVTDELHELNGIPGTLVKLKNVDDTTIVYDPATLIGDSISETSYPMSLNPKVRRWESKDDRPIIDSLTVNEEGGYIELESGVQVRFEDGHYCTGDYWLVPARTRTGSIEWPKVAESESDEPLALPPAGVYHHYTPVALVEFGVDGLFAITEDLRSFFSSLTDLVAIDYAGGNGQQALPDNKLSLPLRVAITVGRLPISKTPMSGSKVRFSIVQQLSSSPGSLRPLLPAGSSSSQQPIDAQINAEGIAECEWTLGEGMEVQQVMAELYDECGKFTDLPPIYFGATLPVLFYYISGDGMEVPKGGAISTLLQVGIKIGKTPVVSGYEVRFNKTSGTLSQSSVVPTNGIAASMWTLTSTPTLVGNPEQAWAELYRQPDPAGVVKQANVAPIYFNATVEELRGSSAATTGLLKLEIPGGQNPRPLVYGPFSHKLTGLEVPPAVTLGLSFDAGTIVKHTEDYIYLQSADNQTFFKPALITPSTFMVHLFDLNRGERGTILLRWWAIPAEHKEAASGEPIIVQFVGARDIPSGTAGVNVTHTNASADQVRVKITVDLRNGPIIKLRRADAGPVYISEEFKLLSGGIQFGDQPKLPVPDMDVGRDLVAVYLDERDNEMASAKVRLHTS
jgi:Family of unknown function (DUF6519)